MSYDSFAKNYELIRVLGSGAMGTVWLAKHRELGTEVVIKLIKTELTKRADVRARFAREAKIAAQMRCSNVVQVLDYGVTGEDDPYLVMEHLEGETLRQRIDAVGRLSPLQIAMILKQLCRAMTKAHEAGLVHRDLKPDNIFLARDVDMEVVKVLDFGVVKVPDALALDGVDPTASGTLLGTPSYMSPEQAQGLKSVDYRSDLWSIGVIVYESLTGARPFTKVSLGPLVKQITIEPLPLPSQTAPDAGITSALDAWMSRALARDPAARFSSARKLVESFATAAGLSSVPEIIRLSVPRGNHTGGRLRT